MNQVPEERKEAVTKTFAIVGFVAIILFAVWLAVQIVSLMPNAFSSLASIADVVYNYRPADNEMIVATEDSVVNAGESFAVKYSTASEDGFYAFSYKCTDGVSLTVRSTDGELVTASCGKEVELDGSGSTVITVDSEKQRFTDVAYTVRFTGVSGAEVFADNQVTVINASIPTTVAVETGAETEETAPAEVETEPEPEVAGESTTPPSPVTPGEPEVVEEYVYAIPQSDPNGVIDLYVRFLGVGILTEDNTFVRTGSIATDEMGAFQFEVKNLGTKTSNAWSYKATMPGDIDYESGEQSPLKPNERAVITLGFTGLTQTGVESFGATVISEGEVLESNNSFISAVTIVE